MRGNVETALRSERLVRDFRAVREQTRRLTEELGPEDQTVQSMPDVSPTKWHLAHTSWFFDRFIVARYASRYRAYRDDYEQLFNSYYNSVGDPFPRAQRGILSRPTVAEILDYRSWVNEHMERLVMDENEELLQLARLGLQHEQQHQELILTDIKHVLGSNPMGPSYADQKSVPPLDHPEPVRFVAYEGGLVEIGCSGSGFHFDNEGPRHRTFLEDYELADRPINNAEVIEFIESGGYSDPLLWLSDGWAWLRRRASKLPLYWRKKDGAFEHFTLNGYQPIVRAETAAHLSYFEADAIARFLGARLPTESEWEAAATRQEPMEVEFDATRLRPGIPKKDSGPLRQLLGGVWEWTQSPYVPYPGYQTPAGAIGEYNGKFMHNQFVLRGGSCLSPSGHVRATYRNFFPSDAGWQMTGARLARNS